MHTLPDGAMADRVLIIDDDRKLVAMLLEYLGARGLEGQGRYDATSGLATLRARVFDAVILDVMLPDGDGFELCRTIRAESDVPILMLTARGDPADRVVGLELGADDYLPKPFEPRELLARVRAILRRRAPATAFAPPLRFGRLEIDPEARVARLAGKPCALTGQQFALLLALARSAGRALSREALLDRVKGENLESLDRSIDVQISRIRAAIEDDRSRPRRILTLRGVGYLFVRNQDD
jgi:two-component system phosphate regulon response regulator OmpR